MSQSKKNTSEKEITFVIDAKEFEGPWSKAVKKVQKKVQIPGFRKGKAPVDIVKKRFLNDIKEAVLSDYLMERTLQEAKEQGLEPLDIPMFTAFEVQEDESAKVSVIITVWPKVKLANYKKMKIKKESPKLDKKELKKAIEDLRANIKKSIAQKENKDEKDITDEEVDSYIRESLNYESAQKMEEEMEKKMLAEKKVEVERKFAEEVENFLLENSVADVPSLWVYRKEREIASDMARQLERMGIKGPQLEQFLSAQRETIKEKAGRQTKLFVILEEIARKEDIRASEEEIEAVVEDQARYYNMKKDDLLARLKEDEDKWNNVALEIDHNKVFRYLVSLAEGKVK